MDQVVGYDITIFQCIELLTTESDTKDELSTRAAIITFACIKERPTCRIEMD